MYMPENASQEAVIVAQMLDIENTLFVQGFGRLYVRPRTDSWSEQAETYRESNRHPLLTDRKLAT